MASIPESPNREEQLDELLLAYLKEIESDGRVDEEDWLRRFPEFAAELSEFFANQIEVEQLTAPLRNLRRTASKAKPSPEQVLPCRFGDYELLLELGNGGMGVVYQARQVSLDRLVALKMVRSGDLATPQELQRFRNEAEAVAQLDHPRIVPIFEIGEWPADRGGIPLPYFTMKYYDGGNLACDPGKYKDTPRSAAQLLVSVANAVHHAHQRGILHRDLKPSNILLDSDGRPHVADFGLAKRLDREQTISRVDACVGTPAFMAPEQVSLGDRTRNRSAHAVTTASDVYGLGAILYVLLTGQRPFLGATPLETLLLVQTQEPKSPAEVNPRVDRDLATICLKCLEKEPHRRYGTASAVAEDLQRWLDGKPIEARPVHSVERVRRWCRRNPVLAGLTAVTALALVAVVLALSVSVVLVSRERKLLDDQRQVAEQRAAELQQKLYATDMIEAHRHWLRGDIGALANVLDRYDLAKGGTAPNGFEWRYLSHLQRRRLKALQTLHGHTHIVYFTTFSPDGHTIASGGSDTKIRIWDWATGACRILSGHSRDVNWLSFSPDGRTLASASEDATVRLWDLETGASIVLRDHVGDVECVVFSPDGTLLASAGRDNIVRIWHVASRTCSSKLTGHGSSLQAHFGQGIETLAFSPDGCTLASAGHDGAVRLWDVATGKQRGLLSHDARVLGVAYSPRKALLATADSSGHIHLWDAASLGRISTLGRHDGAARAVTFASDGEQLASGGDDGQIRIWSLSAKGHASVFGAHEGTVWNVAFSPTGTHFVTAGADQLVKVWESALPRQYKPMRETGSPSLTAQFVAKSHDLLLWSLDGEIEIWDTTRHVCKCRQELKDLFAVHGGRVPVAMHPGEYRAAATDAKGNIRIFVPGSKEAVQLLPRHLDEAIPRQPGKQDPRFASGLTYTSDGSKLVVLYDGGTLHAWDLSTGSVRRAAIDAKLGAGLGRGLIAAPDPALIVVCADRHVRFWDVEKEAWRGPLVKVPSNVGCVAFSPDGKLLALGCLDRCIRILDVASQQWRGCWQSHLRCVNSVAFSPDGCTLASASIDGSARLWHVATGQEMFALLDQPERPCYSVTFSAEGDLLALVGAPGDDRATVTLWLAPWGEAAER